MVDPASWPAGAAAMPADLDPGLTGRPDRPVAGVDNGYVAGYRVRFDEAGPDARVRTSALLRYAQDVAWRHSEDRGFDRRWYAERGRWWVVRAVDLEVLEPIAMGQTLRVSTAVIGHRRIWARRLAEARLADGTLAARIHTDWVILDDRGRLVRIPEDFGLSFTNPEIEGEILRVAAPPADPIHAAVTPTTPVAVRPHDLDPMGHVNNAAYLDWVEEALGQAGAATAVAALPRRFRMEYAQSAGPGDAVAANVQLAGDGWWVTLAKTDGSVLVRAAGTLGAA
jgi:acyl-ACP thioesterase